jgi:hypothetical protein
MLDTFLKLVDKITELAKQERINKEQLFNQIIEPLFTELQPVIDDYYSLFSKTKEILLLKKGDDIEETVMQIRKSREALLIKRIKVREMSKAINESMKNKKITNFTYNVNRFFYSTSMKDVDEKKSSTGAELIELCDYVLRKDISYKSLIYYIDMALKNMEESWMAIAQSYASVRIYCLNSFKEI